MSSGLEWRGLPDVRTAPSSRTNELQHKDMATDRRTNGRTDEFNRSQGGETARILEELENVKSVLTCWSLYNAVKYPSLCTLYCVCQLMCVCVCVVVHICGLWAFSRNIRNGSIDKRFPLKLTALMQNLSRQENPWSDFHSIPSARCARARYNDDTQTIRGTPGQCGWKHDDQRASGRHVDVMLRFIQQQ